MTENVGTNVGRTACASRSASSPASRRSTSRSWCRCGCSPSPWPAGNAFILKPSGAIPRPPASPSCSKAGLPDGVFNVVNGDKEAVDAARHPDVKAVSFVGSTPIAATSTRACLCQKRAQALNGAKNHMVVMPDADLDPGHRRADGRRLRRGRRALHGDLGRCRGGDATADALVEKLLPRIAALKTGPGSTVASEMGPLITAPASRQGRQLCRQRRGGRRHAAVVDGAAARSTAIRKRQWVGSDAVRQRDAGNEDLPRGNLRAGAGYRARRRLCDGRSI